MTYSAIFMGVSFAPGHVLFCGFQYSSMLSMNKHRNRHFLFWSVLPRFDCILFCVPQIILCKGNDIFKSRYAYEFFCICFDDASQRSIHYENQNMSLESSSGKVINTNEE